MLCRIQTWYIGLLPLYCTEEVDVSGAVDYFLRGLYATLIFLLNSPMMSILIKYIPSTFHLSVWPHLFRGADHEKGERAVEVVPGI